MIKPYYRKYEPADFNEVVHMKLSEGDTREVVEAFGVENTYVALCGCLEHSVETYVIIFSGEIIGVFGVGREGKDGHPWLLATDKIKNISSTFVKQSRDIIRKFKREYEFLYNYIDHRNTTSKRWLAWLGFRFENTTVTVTGIPLYRFYMYGGDN